MVPALAVTIPLIVVPIVGLLFSYLYFTHVARVQLKVGRTDGLERSGLINGQDADKLHEVAELTQIISDGAQAFLWAEYRYMAVFLVVFGAIVFIFIGISEAGWTAGGLTTIAFLTGGTTSIVSGYIGMWIATFSNGRVALSALSPRGYSDAFVCAFKGGCVMGFSLTSLALVVLFILISLFKLQYSKPEDVGRLYEAIAGYGLGGSSIALFGRVGGGIYTKAADVGADLVGKVEEGLDEDSKENPATIADNVGDNVGDIAGMGADLFGSFAEATCACLVVASSSKTPEFTESWAAMMYPLMISAAGIIVCMITSFFATHIMVVKNKADIEPSLKRQLIISTLLMTPTLYALSVVFLPAKFIIGDMTVRNYNLFFCSGCGLWTGLLIGYTTEYYTSSSYTPVQEMADQCKTSAATNIIAGLAVGYKSAIAPVISMSVTIFVSYKLAGMYGIGIGALGILSTLAIGLTIDAYGPIADNAGGIVEMSELGDNIRQITDDLDAAGNTTAAIGKGFAISSAALVSLALFGAFRDRIVEKTGDATVDILNPFVFAGLLIGAMLPYAFSAMTMKSVGDAAQEMVQEVRRQFVEKRKLSEEQQRDWVPDYRQCIMISTVSSLREMVLPGVLVMGSPLLMGVLFGTQALSGLLAGSLVSSVQLALSMSNTGGAWDNTKKYIEGGNLGPGHLKKSATHAAAVTGDTVGDPLKDTSGPALNILMKLAAVESLVFAPFFLHISNGEGVYGYIQ